MSWCYSFIQASELLFRMRGIIKEAGLECYHSFQFSQAFIFVMSQIIFYLNCPTFSKLKYRFARIPLPCCSLSLVQDTWLMFSGPDVFVKVPRIPRSFLGKTAFLLLLSLYLIFHESRMEDVTEAFLSFNFSRISLIGISLCNILVYVWVYNWNHLYHLISFLW